MAHELESVLDPEKIEAALAGLDGWQRDGVKIRKRFSFGSFVEAVDFVNRVARVSEDHNHHPDIAIHYKDVDIELWTHKKNATTMADIIVAGAIQRLQSQA